MVVFLSFSPEGLHIEVRSAGAVPWSPVHGEGWPRSFAEGLGKRDLPRDSFPTINLVLFVCFYIHVYLTSTSLVVLFKVQLTGNLSKGCGWKGAKQRALWSEGSVPEGALVACISLQSICASRVSVTLGNFDTR